MREGGIPKGAQAKKPRFELVCLIPEQTLPFFQAKINLFISLELCDHVIA